MKQLIIICLLLLGLDKSKIFCQEILPSSITSAGKLLTAEGIEISFAVGEIVVGNLNSQGISISNGIHDTEETLLVLPLSLQSLVLSTSGSNAILTWITAQEKGTSYFDIEKSVDGLQFKVIGKVKAIGNITTPLNYKYTDDNFVTSSYYRLRIVDLDGKFHFSNVLYAKTNNNTWSITTYPNPFINSFSINIYSTINRKINLVLNNIAGKTVLHSSYTLIPGNNIISISGTKLSKGAYILNIEMGGTKKTLSIIKK